MSFAAFLAKLFRFFVINLKDLFAPLSKASLLIFLMALFAAAIPAVTPEVAPAVAHDITKLAPCATLIAVSEVISLIASLQEAVSLPQAKGPQLTIPLASQSIRHLLMRGSERYVPSGHGTFDMWIDFGAKVSFM